VADVEGKVVMVTGGSSGLGLSLALAFAEAGALVSICARDNPPLARARERILGVSDRCLAMPADITDEDAMRDWVRRTTEELGEPDALINNASVLGERLALQDYPIGDWRHTMDVNVTGTLIATQAVLPGMTRRRSGSIVTVSSGAAVPPRVRWGAYAVSKAAVESLTLNLAEELRGTGVRANVVDPGALRTEMRAAAYPAEDPARVKDPSSIAPLFLWLASAESAAVNASRIIAEEWLEEVVGR
jgi:NAD(P)-dependent dehydrogenase (short-subunit alcohol dehydrogenase family)